MLNMPNLDTYRTAFPYGVNAGSLLASIHLPKDEALYAEVKFHAIISELSLKALSSKSISDFMDEVSAQLSSELHVRKIYIAGLVTDSAKFMVRNARGLDGSVEANRTEMPLSGKTLPGYTLQSKNPVSVRDGEIEDRFDSKAFYRDHEVVSSLSSVIHKKNGKPWGIIAVFDEKERDFTERESVLLQSIANILALAIERSDSQKSVTESEERLRLSLEAGKMGVWDWNIKGNTVSYIYPF